jgi:hypothetical protein
MYIEKFVHVTKRSVTNIKINLRQEPKFILIQHVQFFCPLNPKSVKSRACCILKFPPILAGDTPWRSWFMHLSTSRKVAGSIPYGAIGIFHWHNPSGCTVAPGVESASNRNEYLGYLLGVKADGAYGWQPYHLHVPIVYKSGSLKLLEPERLGLTFTGIGLDSR